MPIPSFTSPIIPTFNGQEVFCSIDHNGNLFLEGTVLPGIANSEIQKFHFDGENGDRYLIHGAPDREWRFQGRISAPSLSQWWIIISTLENLIPLSSQDISTYRTLVGSDGTVWYNAQVRSVAYPPSGPHITSDGGYTGEVVVIGIIQGLQVIGN